MRVGVAVALGMGVSLAVEVSMRLGVAVVCLTDPWTVFLYCEILNLSMGLQWSGLQSGFFKIGRVLLGVGHTLGQDNQKIE